MGLHSSISDIIGAIVKKRSNLLFTAALACFFFAGDFAFGQNWTQTSAPVTNWSAVAGSADLITISAVVHGGGIYVSTNSGTNWTLTSAPSNTWTSIVCSSNGSLMAAAGSNMIYTTTDLWATWTLTTNAGDSLVLSADGSKLFALNGAYISASTNFGATWNLTGAPTNQNWDTMASSGDGTRLVAARVSGVYISTDSGTTWTLTDGPGYGGSCLASSQDGTEMAIAFNCVYGGLNVSISTNEGVDWINPNAPGKCWRSIAMSANGVDLAVFGNSQFLFSADLGGTWINLNGPDLEKANIALSTDGTKLVAAFMGAGIYTWQPLDVLVAATQTPDPSLYDAELAATITAGFGSTSLFFEWGLDTNYGHITPTVNLQGLNTWNISNLITGLSPYTTYHYQAVAINASGTVLGGDVSFMTVPKFVQVGTNTSWNAFALSADGRELLASMDNVVYISTNLGADFAPTAMPGSVFAVSSNGVTVLSLSGTNLYVSMDRGSTWITNTTPAAFDINRDIATSSDAHIIVASDQSVNVYTSTNFGATWNGDAVPLAALCVACSADGRHIYAASFTGPYENPYVYVYESSINSSIWNTIGSFYGVLGVGSISCSANGSIIVVGAASALISTNGGVSWLYPNPSTPTDCEAACSADGNTIIINSYLSGLYTSPNTATTCYQANIPPSYSDASGAKVMSSADGKTLAAGVYNGPFYLSLPPPGQPSGLSVATSMSNGAPSFQLTGEPGYTYIVQASTNLAYWTNIATIVNSNGTVPFTDPAWSNYDQRFYRTIVP